jgi:hypothetical protein
LQEGLATDETQIEIFWNALTSYASTGGSPIISYELRWDAGTFGLQWTELVGKTTASLLTRFTVTNFVVPGHTYNFQVRSRNKWGWSTLSAIKSIKASTWPNVVDKPITTIDPEDGAVVISWTKPDFNSSPIMAYIIEIQNMNNLNIWFQDV